MSQIPSQMRKGKGGVRDLSTRKWNSEFHLCAGFLLTSKVYSYLRPARHNAFGLCGGRYRLAIALCQLRMMTAITSKSWCQSRLVKHLLRERFIIISGSASSRVLNPAVSMMCTSHGLDHVHCRASASANLWSPSMIVLQCLMKVAILVDFVRMSATLRSVCTLATLMVP